MRGTNGYSETRRAAEDAWKRAWPAFRDARSGADWFDLRETQDFSSKRIDICDALKKPITSEEREALQKEMGRSGPTPEWVKAILLRT